MYVCLYMHEQSFVCVYIHTYNGRRVMTLYVCYLTMCACFAALTP
jgi:hypothetical protein